MTDLFEEVASRLSLKDEAKQSDRDNYFYCGIHGDTDTPDLKLYDKGNWKCHACGASGQDVIRYVAERDGISDFEAAKKLIDEHRLDVEIEDLSEEEKEKRREKKKVREVQDDVVSKAESNLDDEHHQELKDNRGWSEETVEKLRIGWMDKSLYNSLKQKHGDKLEEAGVHFGMTGSGDGTFLIPHLKRNGKPYLITCRDPDPDEGSPKYIQSKSSEHVENDIYYATGKDSDTLIVTEGYPDAVSAFEAGYDAVAAGCGSFEGNMEKVSKTAEDYEQILLVLDCDDTGKDNTLMTGEHLSERHSVRVHEWSDERPEGYDLDDWTSDNDFNIHTMIEEAENFIDTYKSYSPSSVKSNIIGDRVSIRGKVKGQKQGMAIPKKITATCKKCGETQKIDFEEDGLLNRFLLSGKSRRKNINSILSSYKRMGECIDERNNHSFYCNVDEYLDKTWLKVQDLIEDTNQFNVNHDNTLPAYLVKERLPSTKTVRVRGEPDVHQSTDEIILLGDEVEAEEQSFRDIELSEEEKDEYREEWSREDAEKMIASDMVGRPLARIALQLTIHSPVMIPNLNGKITRGSLRTLFFGDGGTYKSDQMKELTRDYNLGEYTTAETSTRSGLVYTVNTDRNIIEWGVLPLNNMGLVAIDGLNRMDQDEMKNLREVLEDQQVTVNMSVKGSAPARTRILGAMNPPNEPMERHYNFLAEAIKDTYTFSSGPDIRRWDLYIPFCEGDVSDSRIAQAKSEDKPYEDEFYKRHVLWAWSLKPEDIEHSQGVEDELVKKTEYLMSTYKFGSIPVVSSAFRDKLLRLTVSMAVLSHSVSENGKVKVKPEHVEEVADYFEKVLTRLQIEELREEEYEEEVLDDTERNSLVNELESEELQIVRAVHKGASSAGEIATDTGMGKRTVKDKWGRLKTKFLIESKPGKGTDLLPKGAQFANQVNLDSLIQSKEKDEGLHDLHEFIKGEDEGGQVSLNSTEENPDSSSSSDDAKVQKVQEVKGSRQKMRNLFEEMEAVDNGIPRKYDELLEESDMSDEVFEEVFDSMKTEGEIYEPEAGKFLLTKG